MKRGRASRAWRRVFPPRPEHEVDEELEAVPEVEAAAEEAEEAVEAVEQPEADEDEATEIEIEDED